ncbi:hypothetical protein SADUNF_Sadunf11G0099700 [Salix dunnii]|uniref:Uncharacterized protein n=1 Tax=Salix dunnii TaxID=1413687 RepID=A0A835JU10_9ROSI|nr:hypothetical protein SADUNF_Sadunf11G0099700 [Salix dunnii]
MNFLMQGFPVSTHSSAVRFKISSTKKCHVHAGVYCITGLYRNMVQKLETIKGGGGSIRVGTTGTIGALMTRELESIKPSSQASASNQAKPRTIPVSVPCSATTARKLQARKSLDEASSSGINRRSPETPRKMKSFNKSTHHMPMLGSDNITLDRTPRREKSDKKATNTVEIVDVKCSNPDRSWANPITSKLKKLGFSKLSESTV